MDFHSLSRKQLQALCKKNKIPANITNVAMADALAALDQVEGLDEILNSSEVDVGTPNVNLRTAGKASTQRKAARAEVEGSTVKVPASARRGARAGIASGVAEQENKDDNVPPVTPAAGRRRATAVSTRKKKEVEIVEEDGDKNDAPKTVGRRRATSRSVCPTKNETPGGASVQRTYSTRRSVRLLENGLSKMSLVDTEDTGFVKDDEDNVSQELSNVSEQVEDSCNTEKGSSLQMDSTVVSEDTLESEVCSSEQNTGYECQSHESASDVKLVSVTEIDKVVGPHGSDEGELEKINNLELGAEPNASDEAGSDPLLDLEETCDSSDLETENKESVVACLESFPVEASADAITEVTGQEIADMVPDKVSVDVTDQGVAGSLSMITDCKIYDQVSNECGEKVSNDEDVNNGALLSQKEQVGVMDEKISHEGDDKEDKNNEPEVEDESDYSSLLEGSSDDQGSAMGVNETIEYSTGDVNQDVKDETEHMNVACGDMTDEDYQHLLTVDDKDSKESDSMIGSEGVPDLDSISSSAGELQEEELKEVKPEQTEAGTHSAPDVTEAQAEESEEPVTGQVSVESASGPIDGEVVSEDVSAIPDQDTVTVSSENVSSDVPVQSVVSDRLKVNRTSDDLNKMTMGELKRMLRNLNLGGEKSNYNKTTDKEGDKKRTALQELPQNQMTSGEAQIDD
ncbi:uncharacterized protein LOC114170711 [Vigna unguiculata]|uniref:uncharacterized protein LOC114170711 n=1 Tax=Vigna unguiculata TaxID=3917 RepID=UPI001016BE9F|nr:uncharacterized protein LOC114170711 [Vigna unguiculata]